MIIVNADDFGKSSKVNRAIIDCFKLGLISSTTILANMKDFEEACHLTHRNNLKNNVGIHINITEGIPLTEQIKTCSLFCDEAGQFVSKKNLNYKILRFSKVEKIALIKEISAQIERCRNMGLPLTHADSHHHIHSIIPVFSVISSLLKIYQINNMRTLPKSNRIGRRGSITRKLINNLLAIKNLRRTHYCRDLNEYLKMAAEHEITYKSMEIFVHPNYRSDGVLIDDYYQCPLLTPLENFKKKAEKISPYPLFSKKITPKGSMKRRF